MESLIRSVYGRADAEYVIKKSRFIATVCEVKSEDEAAAFIEEMKKKYWDARHNCSAYQVGPDGRFQRSSDDGEPAGTAGRPILEVLKKQGLTNTAIVVTRYFGGIKLGASGLIRAYSHAAALALEAADIAVYTPFTILTATVAYPLGQHDGTLRPRPRRHHYRQGFRRRRDLHHGSPAKRQRRLCRQPDRHDQRPRHLPENRHHRQARG